jgi:hypothetical protein
MNRTKFSEKQPKLLIEENWLEWHDHVKNNGWKNSENGGKI